MKNDDISRVLQFSKVQHEKNYLTLTLEVVENWIGVELEFTDNTFPVVRTTVFSATVSSENLGNTIKCFQEQVEAAFKDFYKNSNNSRETPRDVWLNLYNGGSLFHSLDQAKEHIEREVKKSLLLASKPKPKENNFCIML